MFLFADHISKCWALGTSFRSEYQQQSKMAVLQPGTHILEHLEEVLHAFNAKACHHGYQWCEKVQSLSMQQHIEPCNRG